MKIGYIGLGKMGKNMVFNLLEKNYEVVVWNRSSAPADEVVSKGALRAIDFNDLTSQLSAPRVIWIMLTAGEVTEELLLGKNGLINFLEAGDTIIDGGNSNFNDSMRRFEKFKSAGIRFLDVGTSGGPKGARNGACMMIGGEYEVYNEYLKLFQDLCVANGYQFFNKPGAGHFVKMVHNAVEYGFMQSMGEGFDLIKNGPFDDLNLSDVARIWNSGSIIESKLMKLAESAFTEDNNLEKIEGYIEDNGEAQWAVETALHHKVPLTTLSHALFFRYLSRQSNSFSARVVAILRNKFGGHSIKESKS